jgi:CMP-N-acetylneuraminic acid synthetase
MFYTPAGKQISARQQLEPLYARNGLCYCFRRETLLVKKCLLPDNTVPVVTDRFVANIDEPIDLLWAEFLIDKCGELYSTEDKSSDIAQKLSCD